VAIQLFLEVANSIRCCPLNSLGS